MYFFLYFKKYSQTKRYDRRVRRGGSCWTCKTWHIKIASRLLWKCKGVKEATEQVQLNWKALNFFSLVVNLFLISVRVKTHHLFAFFSEKCEKGSEKRRRYMPAFLDTHCVTLFSLSFCCSSNCQVNQWSIFILRRVDGVCVLTHSFIGLYFLCEEGK